MFKWRLNADGTIAHMAGKNAKVDGKTVIEAEPPAGNCIKPKWNGTGWISGATAEELAAITKIQSQSSQPSSEQLAINQLGMMVAKLSAKVVSANA
ncbi:hypothetical protein [Schleiferilactobacillus harbinensis]|jgi:hypothetical protein|uniref:hypothetical protein n=1 Tax=Schleiferilactobacillus harbinensis TaxID=304207 RepID=UPI0024309164|nr:hypothetical protein [Schleiferilactobacillus harbinensis]MCI1850040.1 hypothetical protein [Schleiferilactobacillus harbinensis]